MKLALFAVAILAQISANPPKVQVRTGAVHGTVTLAPSNPQDPEPIYKGSCANLVATAKVGSLAVKAKATGDTTTGICTFKISEIAIGTAAVSIAFESADLPAGDLASTSATIIPGDTAKLMMKATWPIVQKQQVSITYDHSTQVGNCTGRHVKITGAKSLDLQLEENWPKCTKLINLVPGSWTFTLHNGVNPDPNFQPQTANVVIQPSFPITFKLPEMGGISARFYPKVKPAVCDGLTFEISQANVVKATLPFKPAFGESCYTVDWKLLIAPPLDLKIKSGNNVLYSAQKTLQPLPNVNMWEVKE